MRHVTSTCPRAFVVSHLQHAHTDQIHQAQSCMSCDTEPSRASSVSGPFFIGSCLISMSTGRSCEFCPRPRLWLPLGFALACKFYSWTIGNVNNVHVPVKRLRLESPIRAIVWSPCKERPQGDEVLDVWKRDTKRLDTSCNPLATKALNMRVAYHTMPERERFHISCAASLQ